MSKLLKFEVCECEISNFKANSNYKNYVPLEVNILWIFLNKATSITTDFRVICLFHKSDMKKQGCTGSTRQIHALYCAWLYVMCSY